MHVFRECRKNNPKLVFLAGSGTAAPVFDVKVLYRRLLPDYRIIIVEKPGYGCPEDLRRMEPGTGGQTHPPYKKNAEAKRSPEGKKERRNG